MTRPLTAGLLVLLAACGRGSSTGVVTTGFDLPVGDFGGAVEFTGTETLQEAEQSGAPNLSLDNGDIRYFVGFQTAGPGDRNPIVLKYEDGTLAWARTDYDVSTDDGTAYGLYWGGIGEFFVVFLGRTDSERMSTRK